MEILQVKMEPESQLDKFESNVNEQFPFVCNGLSECSFSSKMAPNVKVDWEKFKHLCEEVAKFSAIWDKQHPDHKRPKLIQKMWAQIDEKCPEYEGKAKHEWTKPGGIRERFRKEIQKGKKTVKSGAITKEVWVSKWPLLNICKFLLPQFGHRITEGNLEDAASEESQETNEDEKVEEQEIDEGTNQLKEVKFKLPKNKSMEEKTNGKKHKYYLKDEDLIKILMKEDSEEELFGKTVAKKLKKLTTSQRSQAMIDVLSCLQKFENPYPCQSTGSALSLYPALSISTCRPSLSPASSSSTFGQGSCPPSVAQPSPDILDYSMSVSE